MSFLNNDKLREIIPSCITPYNLDYIENSSYELTLAGEHFSTSFEDGVKKVVETGQQLIIEPGQFALLITNETVNIPKDLLALISIKASVKFRGLVNVSGFHVDPGFNGKLKFSVYNAGSNSIVLDEEQRLFPIWFCELTDALKTEDLYKGKFQNQSSITNDDVMKIKGEVLSPLVLNEKIKELEKTLQNTDIKRTIFLTILLSICVLILTRFIFSELTNSQVSQKQRELEGKINSMSEINNLNNTIFNLKQKQAEIENKINSLPLNTNMNSNL